MGECCSIVWTFRAEWLFETLLPGRSGGRITIRRVGPGVYVNVFKEWSPEEEISLFSGAISGDSSLSYSFKLVAPSKPGAYRIRAYIAPLVSPVIDFNGTQIKGSMVSNHLPQFVETKLVVFPKRLKGKVVNEDEHR